MMRDVLARLGAAAVLLGAAGCGAPTPGPLPAATSSVAPATAFVPAASPSVGVTGPGAVTPTPATTAVPTPSTHLVRRPTVPTLPAPAAGRVPGSVRYSDGLRVTLGGPEYLEETSRGPGAFPGREAVGFDVTVVNGTGGTISLDSVVFQVATTQGTLTAVYAAELNPRDLAGSLRPGARAVGRYLFERPTTTRTVTVRVDLDAAHPLASFRGRLTG